MVFHCHMSCLLSLSFTSPSVHSEFAGDTTSNRCEFAARAGRFTLDLTPPVITVVSIASMSENTPLDCQVGDEFMD